MAGERKKRLVAGTAVLVLALPLAGCWKEQQQALSACNAAIPYHGRFAPRANVVTPMTICMDHKGYRVAMENAYCENVPVPRRSPYCYAPKGFFAGIGFKLEMFNTPGPKPPAQPPL